jgi:hypothetical protein
MFLLNKKSKSQTKIWKQQFLDNKLPLMGRFKKKEEKEKRFYHVLQYINSCNAFLKWRLIMQIPKIKHQKLISNYN